MFNNETCTRGSLQRWRGRMLLALSLSLMVGASVSGADSASARERHSVNGAGVSGFVIFDDGVRDAGLKGLVRDTSATDGQCAELWMDFATNPHKHFDAYAVRVCSGRIAWGRYNKARNQKNGPRWGWTIHGVRIAACTWSPSSGTRKCTQKWPHDSARAGTFRLDWV